MVWRSKSWSCIAAIIAFLFSVTARPAAGQQFRTIIQARDRAFQSVGPGVTALKRDSSGKYYVLAKPATVIYVYDSKGNLVGKIPNANSAGATLRFAVDIDLSPDGLLFVADRGANAVDVFKADGTLTAKVQVVAPTSVVALSEGQFAVTSLVSKRLVQVRDVQGNVVRNFGDPTDVDDLAKGKPTMDMGKIFGDDADRVYFAFTSVDDPLLRTYDKYGYVGYEAKVPENAFADAPTSAADRLEFGMSVTHFSLEEETAANVTIGSSGDVKFSGGLGTGLLGSMRSGGGYGRAGMQSGLFAGGGGLFGNGGPGGGTLGGTISGELTGQDGTHFQLGMGRMSGFRGGRGGAGAATGQTTSQGGTLQYFGNGSGGDSDFIQPDMTGAFSSSALQASNADDGPFSGVNLLQYGNNGDQPGGLNSSQSFGLPNQFVVASIINSVGFQPHAPPGGFANSLENNTSDTTPAATRPATFGTFPTSTGGGASGGPSGAAGAHDHFEGMHGRYGGGQTGITASMRVNIGDLGGDHEGKPVISAVGIDPATHEIWAGIGDALVHFNKAGEPQEMYYLTMQGGAPLKATAVLVESDRILVAGDPWGIYEFARPDKPALTTPLHFDAVPERVTQPQ
jgi:hypothetical protein